MPPPACRLAGSLDDLLARIDVALDATPGGVGAKMKDLYRKHNVKAIFQGGEKDDIADVFFHGYANYENGIGKDFLKLTSCNTTGLVRAVDALDRVVGIEKVAITIIRRVADPGDTHRGLVDVLQVEKVPNHQCVDLMKIMPHVHATGLLVHTPVTHGHIINLVATPKESISVAEVISVFKQHPASRWSRSPRGITRTPRSSSTSGIWERSGPINTRSGCGRSASGCPARTSCSPSISPKKR